MPSGVPRPPVRVTPPRIAAIVAQISGLTLKSDGQLATLRLVRAPPTLQQAPEVTITPRTVARTRTPAVRLARMSPPTALTLLPTRVKPIIAAAVTNSPSTIRLRGENTVAIWLLRSIPRLMLL